MKKDNKSKLHGKNNQNKRGKTKPITDLQKKIFKLSKNRQNKKQITKTSQS